MTSIADNTESFATPQRIAVVGVSPTRKKFGYTIFSTLKARGYEAIPIHPVASEVDGEPCRPSLAALENPPEAAVVAVQPEQGVAVVDDAARAGVKRLWFQQGADFSAAARRAELAGIETVTGKCILMYARPVTGIHAVHRFLAKLFKRL
ncbi:CoA-binding protein [candidate division GN15 bacterium]|nr:CoA-binding protein [candidate division GN15 bacterium]